MAGTTSWAFSIYVGGGPLLDMGWKQLYDSVDSPTLNCMQDFQSTSIEQPCGNSWLRIWLKIQAILREFENPSSLYLCSDLLPRHNAPSPDQIIRVPRKQRLPVRAPRQTHALRLSALLAHGSIFRLQLIDLALLLEIENNDGA